MPVTPGDRFGPGPGTQEEGTHMGPHITRGPPADGGYPADNDLHQMSDDGGPVGPDPARWYDPEWRDDAEEDGDIHVGPAVFTDPGVTIMRPPEIAPPAVHYRPQRRRAGLPRHSDGGDPGVPVMMSVRTAPVWMSVWDAGGVTAIWAPGSGGR